MARNENYENMLGANAVSHREKAKKAEIEHIRVYKGEGGGHILEHHMKHGDGHYQEPKRFPFGKGQGKEMAAHLKEHMGVEEVEADKESAAGAAS